MTDFMDPLEEPFDLDRDEDLLIDDDADDDIDDDVLSAVEAERLASEDGSTTDE